MKSKYLLSDTTLMRIKALFETDKQIEKGPRDEIGYKIFRSRIIKSEVGISLASKSRNFDLRMCESN